jgi:hypothetical protein
MINCDRCGLFSAGQSSVYKTKRSKENSKEDYESLKEYEDSYEKYTIVSGYGSTYDGQCFELTGNISTLEELKNKYPWITNIGQEFDNLCDDCITKMLINKEVCCNNNDGLVTPFYTGCCDKLFREKIDITLFYNVDKINLFPYLSYFKFTNWDIYNDKDLETYFIKAENSFFTFYPGCTICKDCLTIHRDKMMLEFEDEHMETEDIKYPYYYTLRHLRAYCQLLNSLEYDSEKGKELTLRSYNPLLRPKEVQQYRERYYAYKSKKNNLLLKKELSYFFAKRNLSILRNYFPISNDVISSILKYF